MSLRALIGIGLLLSTVLGAASDGVWQLGSPIVGERAAALSVAAERAWVVRPDVRQFEGEVDQIRIPLADRGVLIAVRERVMARAPDDLTWIGRMKPDGTTVVITVRGRSMAGKIYTADSIFELRPDVVHGTVLMELEPGRLPACSGGEMPDWYPMQTSSHAHYTDLSTARAESTKDTSRNGTETVRIDTLVAFSSTTSDLLGGQEQIEAVAQLAVDLTNLSFANSNVDVVMRLVHAEKVASIQESASCGGSSGDLRAARDNTDLHLLRDTHHADLVAAITDGGYCGCAYVQQSPELDNFESWGYQATALPCAVGSLTVAHEYGHNLGMEHHPDDPGADPSDASFPWSYGHRVNGEFRTVMAYFDSDDCVNGCWREPHFSNPDVDFEGTPTGIADERDNARTARAIAPLVRDFRIAPDEAMPQPGLSPAVIELALIPDETDQVAVTLSNNGNDLFEWALEQTELDGSSDSGYRFDSALDEIFELPDFTVIGRDEEGKASWEVFDRAGGYTTSGEVVGVSFDGDVVLHEQDDLASNLGMILTPPEGGSYWFGASTSRPWDFGSADQDGFYQTGFEYVFDSSPLADKGRWRLWFTNHVDEEWEQTWSNVRVTLHKTPLPAGCDAPAAVPWLVGVSPDGGTLASGSSELIAVTIDSSGLSPGSYQAALCLKISDPRIQTLVMDVELTVQETDPEIFSDRFEAEGP